MVSEVSLLVCFFFYNVLYKQQSTIPEGFGTVHLPQKKKQGWLEFEKQQIVSNVIKKETIFCFEAKTQKKS